MQSHFSNARTKTVRAVFTNGASRGHNHTHGHTRCAPAGIASRPEPTRGRIRRQTNSPEPRNNPRTGRRDHRDGGRANHRRNRSRHHDGHRQAERKAEAGPAWADKAAAPTRAAARSSFIFISFIVLFSWRDCHSPKLDGKVFGKLHEPQQNQGCARVAQPKTQQVTIQLLNVAAVFCGIFLNGLAAPAAFKGFLPESGSTK